MPLILNKRKDEYDWGDSDNNSQNESEIKFYAEEDAEIPDLPVLCALRGNNRVDKAYKMKQQHEKESNKHKVRGAVDITFKTQFTKKNKSKFIGDPVEDEHNI